MELTLTRRCLHLKQPFRDFLANGRICDGAPLPVPVGFILDMVALKGRSKNDKSTRKTGESDTRKPTARLGKVYMCTCELSYVDTVKASLRPTMMTHSPHRLCKTDPFTFVNNV